MLAINNFPFFSFPCPKFKKSLPVIQRSCKWNFIISLRRYRNGDEEIIRFNSATVLPFKSPGGNVIVCQRKAFSLSSLSSLSNIETSRCVFQMKWLIRIVYVYISEGSCATIQDGVFQTVRFAPIESNFLFFLLFLKGKREETAEMKQDPWLWSDSFSPSRCTWSSLYGWMGKEVRRESSLFVTMGPMMAWLPF